MTLLHMKRTLERDLDRAHAIAVFRCARTRHAALSAYESTHAVLAVLEANAAHDFDEKESLLHVLLMEQQSSAHPLWTTMLLLAFFPMLCRLCGRIHGDEAAAEERDQLVVSIFLEVVADYPLERRRDRTFLRLRQMTQKRVFRRLRAERRMRERVAPDYEIAVYACLLTTETGGSLWPAGRPATPQRSEPDEQPQQIAFLHRHAGALVNGDIEPVIATLVYGERLPDYVARRYPDRTEAERRRIYQRIKRHHTRTMHRLRQHLQPLHDDVTRHRRMDAAG